MKVCVRCEERFEALDWRCPKCGSGPEVHQGYLSFSAIRDDESDGFEAGYFENLAKVEEANFWFQGRNRLLLWALKHYFPECSGLLEVGCGTGFVLEGVRGRFPEMRISGSDVFASALPFAAKRLPGATLLQMDARHMPFDREFDVIGLFDVLEHIQEDELVLSEIFRSVKPGGGIMLAVPQHPFLWSIMDEHSFHKRRYRRADLVSKVEGAGFRVLRTTSFVSLLLPLMYLSRSRHRIPASKFDRLAEFRMGRALNGFLGAIMTLERWMIESGVSLPAGGSLLVVAQRPRS
ncbi:MAG TPA: methyltransferase domain-containing protein [Bryobacteraceae bacterium]|nr:methyltransferase domain-containing protein [Bryobacteraceae bacterium]